MLPVLVLVVQFAGPRLLAQTSTLYREVTVICTLESTLSSTVLQLAITLGISMTALHVSFDIPIYIMSYLDMFENTSVSFP